MADLAMDRVVHALRHSDPIKQGEFEYMIFCPGCRCGHGFRTQGSPSWTFNGDFDKPTISPSLLVRYVVGEVGNPKPMVCHSFIRDGQIEFLSDCTHALAGKTVPLEPF